MDLNYHHLQYFWAVAREGSLTKAAASLHVTPQTVSEQLRDLEAELGQTLFDRSGRTLALTETGRLVYQYADDIFQRGRELTEILAATSKEAPLHLTVGVAPSVPRLVAQRFIAPVMHMGHSYRIQCRETTLDQLLGALAVREIDLIVSDQPAPRGHPVKTFRRVLGEWPVVFMAEPTLRASLVEGFPGSLDGAPLLLPTAATSLRRDLDRWFEEIGVTPVVVGEFDNPSLLKAFGHDGAGAFAVPALIEADVAAREGVERIGEAQGLTQRFYALTPTRRPDDPLVAAICGSSRRSSRRKGPSVR